MNETTYWPKKKKELSERVIQSNKKRRESMEMENREVIELHQYEIDQYIEECQPTCYINKEECDIQEQIDSIPIVT